MSASVTSLARARLERDKRTVEHETLLNAARYLEVYAAMHGHCDTRADIRAHAQALREMAAKKAKETSDADAG